MCMKIVFMGTPEFAVGTLKALVERGKESGELEVVAVVTQPDKPVGRHAVLTPPAVKSYALEHNIPVLQPEKMKDESFVEELRSYNADLFVVVAFRMLPEVVWSMPRFGTFNVHASLLPQYRGAAPINWAIINGESKTGVTTFFLDHQIDTGKMILQKELEIGQEDNVEIVYDRLMALGAELALETIELIAKTDGNPPTVAQPAEETGDLKPAPKIFKETCQLDWSKTAQELHNFVRGLSPVPGAWGKVLDRDVKIYKTRVAEGPTDDKKRLVIPCTEGYLEVLEIQPLGKKRMTASDFMNGLR